MLRASMSPEIEAPMQSRTVVFAHYRLRQTGRFAG